MWLFTNTGFISIINKNGAFEARARDLKSLQPLAQFADTTIIKTPEADYPYRVVTTPDCVSQWVAEQVASIFYSNFKNEVYLTRGLEFSKPLHKVWSVMHDVEDENARLK